MSSGLGRFGTERGRGLPLPFFRCALSFLAWWFASLFPIESAFAHTCPAPNTEHYYSYSSTFGGHLSGTSWPTFSAVASAYAAAMTAQSNASLSGGRSATCSTGPGTEDGANSGWVKLVCVTSNPGPPPFTTTSESWHSTNHACRAPTSPTCPTAGTPHEGVVGGLCVGDGCAAEGAICMTNDVTGLSCKASPVETISADGSKNVSGRYTYTGDTCTDAPFIEKTPKDPQGCVTGANGKTVCMSTPGCGTVNGEAFCVSDAGASNCATNNVSGVRVCKGDAPTTSVPDNGTPGVPAAPDAVVTTQPGSSVTNVYSSSTVSNSTNYGTGGDPEASGNCGAPGQPACSTKGNCGGPGQPMCKSDIDCGGPGEPKCGVKIDETGVAEADDNFVSGLETRRAAADAEEAAKFDEAIAGVGSGGAKNPATGWLPGSLFPDVPESSCQTIEVQFFNLPSKAFPPPILCDFIESKLKPLLAFFLYVVTAGMIIFAGIRTMAPGGS